MSELWQYIQGLGSPLSMNQIIVDLGFSIIASLVIYLLYQMFYGSRHIGAGVHRTFIIGGPAITALFLGIQVSIPLSLGLLGALSFVRFRTPVKDPAEIGFLLLLIASSIGAATNNFLITSILIIFVFVALVIHWLTRNRISVFGRGQLMISPEGFKAGNDVRHR
jgi:predicted Na+-dependent transporter